MKNTLSAPMLILVIFILLIAAAFFDSSLLKYRSNVYLSVIVLHMLVFILPSVFYCKLKETGYNEKLQFKLFAPRKFLFLIFIFISMLCVGLIIKIAQYNMGIYAPQLSVFDDFLPPGAAVSAGDIYIMLAYALFPAITEEFLFRSILITEYAESGVGLVNAVLLTSLLYGMLDGGFVNFFLKFINGLFLGFIFIVAESFFAVILIHFTYNLFVLFIENYIMRLTSQAGNPTFYIFIMISLALLFAIFALGKAERLYYMLSLERDVSSNPDYIKSAEGESDEPDGDSENSREKSRKNSRWRNMRTRLYITLKNFSFAAISPSYIACFLLFIAMALFPINR
jgi:membrane protease YdiL (CAAX protease family)